MTYDPSSFATDAITSREIEIYNDVFMEEVNALVPSALKSIYDEKKFVFVDLPGKCAQVLEMYPSGTDSVRFPIEEFSDYLDLNDLRPTAIMTKMRELALIAAESYSSNVKNAYIKGGRLRLEKLYLSRWNDFRVHVVKNGDAGWAAFRYRFVAGKISPSTHVQ